MFVNYIRLRNIRCFADVYIDFDLAAPGNRKWTVLVGENGTGKSTVLQALALSLLGSDALFRMAPTPSDWLRQGCEEGGIELRRETKMGEARTVHLAFRREDSARAFLERNRENLAPLDEALAHASRNYMTIGYGASRRLVTKGAFERQSGPQRLRSVASLFDDNATLNPLTSWAMQVDYETSGEGLSTVSQVLTDFLPEVSFSHVDRKRGQLIFDTPDGSVALEQLSNGCQTVAAWVGDLLYQISDVFEDFKNPFEARCLLIIDELDLHLHPKWQRRLLDFLDSRLPNMQLVVTTHSVVTAQQSAPDVLHYCLRSENGVLLKRFIGDPRNLLVNQLLATTAFGNASDESLSVEQDKEVYATFSHWAEKTPEEEAIFHQVIERLGQRPESNEAPFLNRGQLDILQRLEQLTLDQVKK